MTEELARQVRRVRKSGFTIAPEAGTQRLRNVINKNLDERQILAACRLAFEAGWDLIKLYFMIGLPTETDADVDGLVDLAPEIHAVGRRAQRGRKVEVTLSASSFVPKPVTPIQCSGRTGWRTSGASRTGSPPASAAPCASSTTTSTRPSWRERSPAGTAAWAA